MEDEKPIQTGTPSPKAQSWGAFISIVIIVLMIIIGAFYAWGKRITEENAPAIPTSTTSQ
jgi:hypothetical protein